MYAYAIEMTSSPAVLFPNQKLRAVPLVKLSTPATGEHFGPNT